MTIRNSPENSRDEKIDLTTLLNVLKEHRLSVVLVTLLFVLISGILNFYWLKPVYEAKAVIMVTRVSDNPQTIMNTYVGQVKSDFLMQRVITKLNLNDQKPYRFPEIKLPVFLQRFIKKPDKQVLTPPSLSRQVEAAAVKDSNLIEITVLNTDPRQAAQIANTLGQEFIWLVREKHKEMIQQSLDSIHSQIVSVQQQMVAAAGEPEKRLYEDTLALLNDRTRIAGSIDMGNTGMVMASYAIPPVNPVKPDKMLNMSVSMLLGLMVSIALVFIKESLNNRIITPEDVAEHLNVPVLGMIAHSKRRARA